MPGIHHLFYNLKLPFIKLIYETVKKFSFPKDKVYQLSGFYLSC